ncbi:MAG: 2-oxoacid:acceptor oxidoreductase family protein [Sphaerochaetaceae bacterium]|nr:2-oxoacid:acceptor oxidoreductase family protein [Sphaerochaetaceae bacterium]
MANKENQIVIAGFGGQGLLFAGKVLAYAGLSEDRQLSWLPSYGPEMRGGTANCNVILSDEPVGSPIVSNPDILMVMNSPSLDKYEDSVVKDGYIFCDSSLISRPVARKDVKSYAIPATEIAKSIGAQSLANMVLLGAIVKVTGCISQDALMAGLKKAIPPKKAELFDLNLKALEAGKDYVK